MKAKARPALLAVSVVALLLVPAAVASAATVNVTLTGAGAGTVTSSQGTPPIDCSIAAGVTSGECSATLPDDFGQTVMSATPGPGSFFSGWSGGCSGTTTSCTIFNFGTVDLTASFGLLPDPPSVATGDSGPGPNELLIALEGTVNPEGFEVSECRFEYDTRPYEEGEGPHGTKLPCDPSASALGEGEADVAVGAFAEVEQLLPETTYHYRLVAANQAGTVRSEGRGESRTFATGAAPPPSGCPNDAIRSTQPFGVITLPDCMALELVSPPRKDSQLARSPSISADGERVVFSATGAFVETPSFTNPLFAFYISSRTDSGWVTSPTGADPEIINGAKLFGQPLTYTPDFSHWLTIGSTQQQFPQGIARAYSDGLEAPFEPFSPLLVPIASTPLTFNVVWGTIFQGASADHTNLYFAPGDTVDKTQVSYLPPDPEPRGAGGDRHVYVASLDPAGEPSLELLARDSDDKVWGERCGARLGGIGPAAAPTGRGQGAIATDGSRVYLSARPTQPKDKLCSVADNKLRILKRIETSVGPWISELIPNECARTSPACSSANGDDTYEAASLDQTKVYFTTNRQLADSDVDPVNEECSDSVAKEGCDLYLYDTTKPAGERLVQVSAGEDAIPGAGAKVFREITGVSTDGSRAYFVAAGVLTADPNPAGASAVEGQPNLYVWEAESESIALIGTLSSDDQDGLWGRAGTFVNTAWPVPAKGTDNTGTEIGGDGHILLFISKASLVADDTDGGRSDVYRYDGEGTGTEALLCISCRPGGPDTEPFDVNGRDRGGQLSVANETGTDLTEIERWVSEDGEAVVFTTQAGLLSGDGNDATDAYLWREGQLYRLPKAASATISADGGEVAFSTFAPLTPFDVDTAQDVYVARAEGGFEVPTAPTFCQGEGCQEPFAAQPQSQENAIEAQGSGSVKPGPNPPRRCPKGKRKVRRQGKARCVKRATQPQHPKHANADRRAAK